MLLVIIGALGLAVAAVGGWLLLTGRPVGGALLGASGLAIAAISLANSGVTARRSRARVEHEGRAQLCRSHHVPFAWIDTQTGIMHRTPDDAPLHLDVELMLWNSGGAPVTLFEAESATVRGQAVEATRYPGNFSGTRLEPNGPRVEQRFSLEPTEGEVLHAAPGDKLAFRIRSSDRRAVRVVLSLESPT